jgi:lysophospholipase L1-like esterase
MALWLPYDFGGGSLAQGSVLPPDPLTIFGSTDLIAWYDPSDAATVTQSGGLVSQVNDKSGHAHHLTATGTQRPTYSATAIQGQPGLVFNGSTNVMTASGVAPGSTSALSMFMLTECDSAPAQFHSLAAFVATGDSGGFGSSSVFFFQISPATGKIDGYHSADKSDWNTVYAAGAQPPMGKQIVRLGSVFDGTNHTFFLDNLAATPVSSTGTLGSTGAIQIGNRADASQPWTGTIGEIIALRRAPTSTERDKLQRWFVRNWTRILVTEGDSVVHGAVGSPAIEDGYVKRFSNNASPSTFVDNIAIGGSSLHSDNTTQSLAFRASAGYANRIPTTGKDGKKYIFYAYVSNNIGGPTNNGVDEAAAMATYLAARKAEGYDKVGCATIIGRSDAQQNDVARHAYNTAITTAGWKEANGVDFVVDLAADSIMGVDDAPDVNPTYFADQVHPNAAGHARLEAIFTAAINSVI